MKILIKSVKGIKTRLKNSKFQEIDMNLNKIKTLIKNNETNDNQVKMKKEINPKLWKEPNYILNLVISNLLMAKENFM